VLAPNGKSLQDSACAVVGGGHGLWNGHFGAEIDKADVVIRVNRLPPSQGNLAEDLGRRTDVYVLDRCSGPEGNYVQVEYVGGYRVYCDLRDVAACPFSAILFRGNNQRWESGCVGEIQNNDGLRASAHDSRVAVGMEMDITLNAVMDLRKFEPPDVNKPTTGLHAVVMMAFACSTVRLYGFAGSATLDGHPMHVSHNIDAEHALLAILATVEVDGLSASSEFRAAWRNTDFRVVC